MSVTAQYVLYKKEFEPIVKINDHVGIMLGPGKIIYGRVVFIEPVQPQVKNLGPLSAATTSKYPMPGTEVTLNELKLGEHEFGQWRLIPLDNFAFKLNIMSGYPRWLNLTGQTLASQKSAFKDQFLEIYTYEDIYIPTVQPFNLLFKDLTFARLLMLGFRYVLEIEARPPATYTVIPVAGIAATPRAR